MHRLSVAAIAQAYAEGRFGPVELVTHLLDRIDRHEPEINAFIEVHADQALAAARQAEQELRAGRSRGPLHGIPVGVKDNIDMAGERTTCHSRILLENRAHADAPVIHDLRAAGAIFMGKLSLHEFAIGGPSFDLPFPPARNPWNRDHHPGGSSSGSGAALAAGFVPLALGTDTGGSVRNPAAACGIAGLKPSYDLISRNGVFPLSYTLDHVGPMARSVRDLALALDVLCRRDLGLAPRSYAADLDRGVRGLRIGYVRHFHESDLAADPDMAAALDEAAGIFGAQGAQVQEVRLPSLQSFAAVHRIIFLAEAWNIHAPWLRERPGDYARTSRRKLLPGAFFTAGDYVRAQQHRLRLIDAVNDVFRDVDVLLVANSLDPACRIDDADEVVRTYTRQARVPFNLTGHPALALPCGMSAQGLPLSLQLVGRPYDECGLLRAGAALEAATAWHEQSALPA